MMLLSRQPTNLMDKHAVAVLKHAAAAGHVIMVQSISDEIQTRP